ncbi:MAG: PAS domain S-box protein [Magnetospirillum sp.]|nr:PAS domain S-box protein [Magnetospirillum sp.]
MTGFGFSIFHPRAAVQAMPLVAMTLIAMLLAVMLWLLHRNEVEEERDTLIMDILWVEQNLHFNLTSGAEKLARLAGDAGRLGSTAAPVAAQGRHLLATTPELARIIVRGDDGAVEMALPPLAQDVPAADASSPRGVAALLALSLGRPTFGPAFAAPGLGQAIELTAPVYRDGRAAGSVVAMLSLDAMLAQHVPWWVAEKYRIEIVDGDGTVLAEKTKVSAAREGASYQVRLDPPGYGLAVVATVYRGQGNLPRNLLAAAIFGLALSAVLSLAAMRRHGRRRLAAEAALREEHAFRKAMEDSLTVGMRARDRAGRITYANAAFCRMVGWSAGELVGLLPPAPYWLPEDIEGTTAMHERVMRGEAPADGFEIRFRRKSGEVFWALVYEAPLIDAAGAHSGWMASVLDITERKRAEEMARQQQETMQRTARLISMGEMASTMAHELNPPLSAIASYNTGCLNRLASGSFTAAELETALTKLGVQAQRAGQIIRRIHDFVRKSEPKLAPCALRAVVEDAVGFIAADAAKYGVTIRVAATRDAMVNADRILLEQVLLNLTRNAIEAMSATAPARRLLTVSVTEAGGEATVGVADRGPGIAEDAARNLYQPFFTTKAEGMGMGLNICRSIVELHHGRLWFEPSPEGGSVFTFSLPVWTP